MRVDEVAANVEHFTVRRDGPRARAVHTLVLSAVTEAEAGLAEVVRAARRHHIRWVVVHAAADAAALLAGPLGREVDRFVAVASASSPAPPAGVVVSVPLDAATVAALPDVVGALRGARQVVFTWPFPAPGAQPPPPAAEVLAAVRRVAPALDGVPWALRGVPPCVWGPELRSRLAPEARRSANRFYVDAEHQLDGALVFFPDVVAWAKPDACRACALDTRCDGVVGAWLDHGLLPPLEPIDA